MTDAQWAWLSESQLAQNRAEIDHNWSRRLDLSFEGVDGIHINATGVPAVEGAAAGAAIVLFPGRTEALVKYRELALDLNRRGHAVYLLDHRGQGQSGRLLADPERGHVVEFEHYIDDAETFIETQVRPQVAGPLVLFAHSMGGCIAARLLQRRLSLFNAAVLFAPMFTIQTGAIPAGVARVLIGSLAALPVGGGGSAYVPGGAGFAAAEFERAGELNPLTHSRARYARLLADYGEFPETRLGSPTRQWFSQAQSAMAAAIGDAELISTPTLVFNAGDDPIVGHRGQQQFCDANPLISGPSVIAGARHELLMESDAIRSCVLDDALAFVAAALAP